MQQHIIIIIIICIIILNKELLLVVLHISHNIRNIIISINMIIIICIWVFYLKITICCFTFYF